MSGLTATLKKVLITGSSSGLGLATAKQVAKLGAEVIMAVRSGIPEKGEEVKQASGSETGVAHAKVLESMPDSGREYAYAVISAM